MSFIQNPPKIHYDSQLRYLIICTYIRTLQYWKRERVNKIIGRKNTYKMNVWLPEYDSNDSSFNQDWLPWIASSNSTGEMKSQKMRRIEIDTAT